jgi:outer membrane receptor protein involved in Fe transport
MAERLQLSGLGDLSVRTRFLGASVLAIIVAQAASARAEAQTAPPASKGIEEVVVTAQKRSEKLQRVPESIQVLDAKQLRQLNITEFQDYVRYIPSLQVQTFGPNQTTIYLRGVSDGGNANHSGPLPLVGSYLDEMPTTTIGGTLDVHLYDIDRVEVLAGPQGTLYGASSEAGTVRYLTKQPNPSKFEAGYTLEGNVVDHGGLGGIAEGFVNIPINDKVAVRLVGYDEHDAGYIDNVASTRTFATSGGVINNKALAKNDFNPNDTFGGRAQVRVDLNDDWTITPEVMAQDNRSNGIFAYEPSVGDLKVERFQPDTFHDRWVQAAMNVVGHIGDYTLTYAGGFFVRDVVTQSDYTDYSVFYDAKNGSGAYWTGNNGLPLSNPSQEIDGKDHFNKESNELRLASPSDQRFRFIVGIFQQNQGHNILQDYLINGLQQSLWVPGWRNTLWLTHQQREDNDLAAFTEVSYDVTDKFTVMGGVRPYYYDNSLKGFFGFNDTYSSHTGVAACKPGSTYPGAPCEDLYQSAVGSGETHKINLTYKLDANKLVYFTYSTGFRPGGINRRADQGNYQADSLNNYEIGFKSSWLENHLIWNTAAYIEDWNQFQFAYLGLNSFTIIKNAPTANIKGVESSVTYRPIDPLTVNGSITLTDAKLTQDFCTDLNGNVLSSCSGPNVDPTSIASKGNALPYTPSAKGFVMARYTFPLVADWTGYAQGDVTFQSYSQAALRDQDKYYLGGMPAFAVFGLSTGATKGNLSFDLFAKNLGDSRGEENRYTPCTINVCALPIAGIPRAVYVVPIMPLTVGFRLSQHF